MSARSAPSAISRLAYGAALAAALLAYGLGAGWAVDHGRFVADEGFYALAADQVYEGRVPYRDFLFTQMPLLPYVYGLWFQLTGAGVIAGRWLSLGFGLGAIALLSIAVRRAAGRDAGIVAAVLLGANLSFVSDTSKVVTQPLTAFLCAAAVLAMTHAAHARRVLGAGLLLALAVLTRLSLLPALLLFWAAALGWSEDARQRRWVLALALAHALVGALVLAALSADGNLLFGVLGFHREVYGDAQLALAGVFDFARASALNHLPILVCFAVSLMGLAQRARARAYLPGDALLGLCALSFLACSVLHATRAVAYVGYQTSIVVFAVAAAALGVPWLAARMGMAAWALPSAVFVLCLAGAPLQSHWIHASAGTPVQLREASAALSARARPGARLLSPHVELALGTGVRVLPGYELGQFSYFPLMEPARADRLRVLHAQRFFDDVERGRADFVCFTPRYLRLFAGSAEPQLRALIARDHTLFHTVAGYGQFQEPLWMFERRRIPSVRR